jgi:hypothetical protein
MLFQQGRELRGFERFESTCSLAGVPEMSKKPLTRPARPDSLNTRQLRGAVRFPLSLDVVLESGDEQLAARTRNVSATGVLFELDRPLAAGCRVRFSLCMPGHGLGTPHDVVVLCMGRVVRCSMSQNQHYAAATIDEYEFVRSSENLAARASA